MTEKKHRSCANCNHWCSSYDRDTGMWDEDCSVQYLDVVDEETSNAIYDGIMECPEFEEYVDADYEGGEE